MFLARALADTPGHAIALSYISQTSPWLRLEGKRSWFSKRKLQTAPGGGSSHSPHYCFWPDLQLVVLISMVWLTGPVPWLCFLPQEAMMALWTVLWDFQPSVFTGWSHLSILLDVWHVDHQGFRVCGLSNWVGPLLRRALCLVWCSAVAVLKLLIMVE